MGPVPQRAPVGHRARGLQRRRRRLELLHPRPGALARLPLGRGRDRRDLATSASGCAWRWRCGTARTRSSRSGCSGSPTARATTARTSRSTGSTSIARRRTRTCKCLYKYPQRAFPYDGSDRHQRPPRQARTWSTSCSTPASSTRTATSTSSSSTPRPRHDDILMLVTAHNRGPDAATLHLLPTLWFRNTWSWGDDGRQAGLEAVDGRRRRRGARVAPRARRVGAAVRRLGGAAVLRERDEQRSGCSGPRTPRRTSRTAINDYVVDGATDAVNPEQDRHQGRGAITCSRSSPAGAHAIRLRLTVRRR